MSKKNICLQCMSDMGDFDVCLHCGWIKGKPVAPKEPIHLEPGTILNQQYIIGQAIKMGGFGIIYHAYDTVLNQHVAIKEYYPSNIASRVRGSQNVVVATKKEEYRLAKGIKRFLDEARYMAMFAGVPSIAEVLNYFEANHTAYMVMEYLEGESLSQYLKRNHTMPEKEALDILNQVLDGLEIMHEKHVIHRDITPNNIMLLKDGRVKVIDLGNAYLEGNDDDEIRKEIVLTPGYAPEEQYDSERSQTPAIDIYGAAATFYHCLSGTVPVEASQRKKNDPIVPLGKLVPHLDRRTETAIMRGLAVDASIRFQTVAEFREALFGKKKVLLPEQIIRRRKWMRVGIVSFCVTALIISLGVLGYRYMNPEKNILDNNLVTEGTTIRIAVADDPEHPAIKESWNAINEQFEQQYDHIKVTVDYLDPKKADTVDWSQYNIISNDLYELPNEQRAELKDIVEYLDMNQYPLLQKYRKRILDNRTISLLFEADVMYLNRRTAENALMDTEKNYSFDEFMAFDTEATKTNVVLLEVAPEAATGFFLNRNGSLLSGKDQQKQAEWFNRLYQNKHDQSFYSKYEYDEKKGYQYELKMMQDDRLIAMIASTDLYNTIKDLGEYGSVKYRVCASLTEQPVGRFKQSYQIAAKDENADLASKIYISFLLSDFSQNYLSLQVQLGLPLNDDTWKTYIETYSELAFMDKKLSSMLIPEQQLNEQDVMQMFQTGTLDVNAIAPAVN